MNNKFVSDMSGVSKREEAAAQRLRLPGITLAGMTRCELLEVPQDGGSFTPSWSGMLVQAQVACLSDNTDGKWRRFINQNQIKAQRSGCHPKLHPNSAFNPKSASLRLR